MEDEEGMNKEESEESRELRDKKALFRFEAAQTLPPKRKKEKKNLSIR